MPGLWRFMHGFGATAGDVIERHLHYYSELAEARISFHCALFEKVSLSEGQQNPVLYQFKVLDVEKARVEKWNGQYPSYYLGTGTGSSGPSMLLQLPPPVK